MNSKNHGYSFKNIPVPSKSSYLKSLMDKTDDLVCLSYNNYYTLYQDFELFNEILNTLKLQSIYLHFTIHLVIKESK